MAGRFNGISDAMWAYLEPHVRREHPGSGRICTNYRNIINSIFYILITGSRWCDLPIAPHLAKRSSAHRWLKRWVEDGTWQKIQFGLLESAEMAGKIDWNRATIDGSFSPWPRRRGRRYDRLQGKGTSDTFDG